MSPATKGKVFDLFFTSRADGTGMGLAFANRIIRKHNGTIAIDSKLGSGTTVTVTIPGGSTAARETATPTLKCDPIRNT